jgi:hypothetical protein
MICSRTLLSRGPALLIPLFLSISGSAAAQTQPDRANLAVGNLFKDPGFNQPCAELVKVWEPLVQKDPNVICRFRGAVWLNHDNAKGDPAVVQTVGGLQIGHVYQVEWSWSAGPTAHSTLKPGPQPIFALKIDNAPPKAYLTNNKITDPKTDSLTFTATKTSATFEFQGEAGNHDGDVVLNWVSLKSMGLPKATSTGKLVY